MRKPKLKIGITSCGGDMVSSALLSLKQSAFIDFEIYAFNSAPHTLSQHIADKFAILPRGNTPEYKEAVLELINKFQLHVIMPWSDEEAQSLSNCCEEIIQSGCVPLVSSPQTLKLIKDKAETYQKLKKAGLAVPEYTVVTNSLDLQHAVKDYGYPINSVVTKPSTGRGGRDVTVLIGQNETKDWVGTGRREKRLNNPNIQDLNMKEGVPYLVMPCLDDPVYDIDVFRFNNKYHGSFIRQRINPTGIPYQGSLVKCSPEVEEYTRQICEVLDLNSLHDLDMMTDPKTKIATLLEVNPRPSGSIAGLNAVGCKLLEFALACSAGMIIPIEKPGEDKKILTFTESLCV